MKSGYTHIVALIDRSYSMRSIWESVQVGLKSFINTQKAVNGKATLSLVVFDSLPQYKQNTHFGLSVNLGMEDVSHIDTVLDFVDLKQVDVNLDAYPPRGNTPLNDAWCETIDKVGSKLALMPEWERPEKVLFFTMTDGEENKSKKTEEEAKAKIDHQTNRYGWEFVLSGANQDTKKVARAYSIPTGNAMNFAATQDGVKTLLSHAGSSATTYRSASYQPGNFWGNNGAQESN